MDESTPSRTALMTSLIRALHSHYDPAPLLDDPWGDRLVPESARGELRQYILAAMDSDARAAALRAPDSILDDFRRLPACLGCNCRDSITLHRRCIEGGSGKGNAPACLDWRWL